MTPTEYLDRCFNALIGQEVKSLSEDRTGTIQWTDIDYDCSYVGVRWNDGEGVEKRSTSSVELLNLPTFPHF